jgi:hypothetical protein
MNRWKLLLSGLALSVLIAPPRAKAGPPLTCHPFNIGNAKSLPWSNNLGNLDGKPDYDVSRLVEDTLALLTPTTPIIVRMETLRRAALYSKRDPGVARDLVGKLNARTLDSDGKGNPDALAWFDLGYLVETIKQANMTWRKLPSGSWEPVLNPSAATGVDGYAHVLKGINLRGEDADMEFAAALITMYPRQKKLCDEHLRKAKLGARDGTLLAKNLITDW